MTRETKIGLLVGLAFVIVIGVLLSDHISHVSQPAPAALAKSSAAVDRSVAVVGGRDAGAVAVKAPTRVEPVGPVATSDSTEKPEVLVVVGQGKRTDAGEGTLSPLAPVNGGVNGVANGSGNPPSLAAPEAVTGGVGGVVAENIGNSKVAIGPAVPPGVLIPGSDEMGRVGSGGGSGGVESEGMTVRTPDGRSRGGAVASGMTVAPEVLGGGRGGVRGSEGPEGGTTTVVVNPEKPRTYKAVEGDSLYRITQKVYGKWTRENAETILKANPQMGPKGAKIVIGSVYAIPSVGAPAQGGTQGGTTDMAGSPGVSGAGNSTVAQAASARLPAQVIRTTDGLAAKFKTYTVKEGDSLWKIANSTGRSVSELESANKDVLKGGKTLKIGMVLKVPTGEKGGEKASEKVPEKTPERVSERVITAAAE